MQNPMMTAFLQSLVQGQRTQGQPVNALAQGYQVADASQDFDQNSIVGRMLAAQRVAEAQRAAQAQAQQGMPQRPPQRGFLPPDMQQSILQQRMRAAGLE